MENTKWGNLSTIVWIQLQLHLAISIMNIFTLILYNPKEAHNMHFKGLIGSQQGEYSHAFPVAGTQNYSYPTPTEPAWSIVTTKALIYPGSRCGHCIFKQPDIMRHRRDAFIHEIDYTGTSVWSNRIDEQLFAWVIFSATFSILELVKEKNKKKELAPW